MAALLFPDNTVLCNFAAVDRISLLRELVRENGRWTQAVYAEAVKSVQFHPPLSEVTAGVLLGEPIEVVDVEQVNRIRVARFGGDPRTPTQHLGEAETCHLLSTVVEYKDSKWLTDDRDAYNFGKQKNLITWDTLDCFAQLVADHAVTADEAFSLMNLMPDRERYPRRMPASTRDFR